MGGGGGGSVPPIKPDDTRPAIVVFHENLSVYPSNCDIQWVGKGVNNDTGNVEYKSNLWTTANLGNTPAPKGHYIIDPFYVDRSTVSGIAGIPAVKDTGTPTCSAFYAGRVWFSGVNSSISGDNSNTGRVFFSQVVESVSEIGMCYQQADPTSETSSQLVDTDGGVIRILGASTILAMEQLQNALLVFATNGVWSISNSTGGFSAKSYSVTKVTSDGCVGKSTVVNVGNAVVYWADTGIISISLNQLGTLIPTNISQSTIQKYYVESIPESAKQVAVGMHDRGENIISWLYYEDEMYKETPVRTHELLIRIALGSFFKYEFARIEKYYSPTNDFPTANSSAEFPFVEYSPYTANINPSLYGTSNSSYLHGYITTPRVLYQTNEVVLTESDLVTEITLSDGVTLVTYGKVSLVNIKSTKKYIYSYNNGLGTFIPYVSTLTNTYYVDGKYNYSSSGETTSTPFDAYLEAGNNVFQDPSRLKSVSYMTNYLYKQPTLQLTPTEIVDGGSCIVSAKWNFTSSSTAKQYSTVFDAYKFDSMYSVTTTLDEIYPGYEMIVNKSNLNGNGHSMRIKLQTMPLRGCHTAGYSLEFDGRPHV